MAEVYYSVYNRIQDDQYLDIVSDLPAYSKHLKSVKNSCESPDRCGAC